jgi:hypothetical protein
MKTIFTLKTAEAADVAGVGYEGFRTWLKRGLLKANGVLPKFYAPHAPAEIADAKRWRWTAFGYADLCSFRLTKILLDSGLSWEAASSIAGDSVLWKSHQSSDAGIQYLVISNQGAEFYPCNREQLIKHFSAGDIERLVMTVIDLEHLRRDVVFRCRAAALRAVATDLKHSSHIYVRSGPNLLSPQASAERKQAIETLADKIDALATRTAPGQETYREYEAICSQLQKLGKLPENSAVSAVAAAFVLQHAS